MGAASFGPMGSGLSFGMAEGEVTVATGASFNTGIAIPAGSMVIGAVARVTQALTGTLATWRLGTADSTNRFGQGLGKGAGSWARGMLGAPMTYYDSANLLMTGEGAASPAARSSWPSIGCSFACRTERHPFTCRPFALRRSRDWSGSVT
ncbi:hypothetical protein ACFSYD_09375 [Paracoccus aerius]